MHFGCSNCGGKTQAWPFEGERLCWFCWRGALGLATDTALYFQHSGVRFGRLH